MKLQLQCKNCPFAVKLKKYYYHCSAMHWNDTVYSNTKANDECWKHLEMAFNPESNAYNWHFIKNVNYPFNLSINKEAIHRWWINVFLSRINTYIKKVDLCIFQYSKFILKIKDKKSNSICFTFHWKTNILKSGNTEIILENPEKDLVKIAKQYRKKLNDWVG